MAYLVVFILLYGQTHKFVSDVRFIIVYSNIFLFLVIHFFFFIVIIIIV